jgi:hypothetical protein
MRTLIGKKFCATAVILAGLLIAGMPACAQGTAFVYQGRLNDGGTPANGSFDLTFALFTTDSDTGQQVGNTLTNAATPVTNGLFACALDFGSGIFTGTNYWLEIGVQTNGGPGFNILSPRQLITPVPYAIMANSASNLLGTLPAIQLSGSLPASALAGYSNPVMLTNPGSSFAGTFVGDGGGLINLNASQLASGLVPLAQLSGITGSQLDAATWQQATNLNGGDAAMASNVVAGISITNAFITNSVFAGNGSGLTNVPASGITGGESINSGSVGLVISGANGATLANVTITITNLPESQVSNLIADLAARVASLNGVLTNASFAGPALFGINQNNGVSAIGADGSLNIGGTNAIGAGNGMFTNIVFVGAGTNIALYPNGTAKFLGGGLTLLTNGFTYLLGSGIAGTFQIQAASEVAIGIGTDTNNNSPSMDFRNNANGGITMFPGKSFSELGRSNTLFYNLWIQQINDFGPLNANSAIISNTVTAGSFSGNGASLTNLNATNISSGTLNAAQLPSSTVQYNANGSIIPAAGTIYMGESAGSPAGLGEVSGKAQMWFDTNAGVLHIIQDNGTNWSVPLTHP